VRISPEIKENVFMMVICIELRIPLFLVGKPGSSKSLAKSIVADAMQGERARSELYQTLKSVSLQVMAVTSLNCRYFLHQFQFFLFEYCCIYNKSANLNMLSSSTSIGCL
jgi:hypothetical protein